MNKSKEPHHKVLKEHNMAKTEILKQKKET